MDNGHPWPPRTPGITECKTQNKTGDDDREECRVDLEDHGLCKLRRERSSYDSRTVVSEMSDHGLVEDTERLGQED